MTVHNLREEPDMDAHGLGSVPPLEDAGQLAKLLWGLFGSIVVILHWLTWWLWHGNKVFTTSDMDLYRDGITRPPREKLHTVLSGVSLLVLCWLLTTEYVLWAIIPGITYVILTAAYFDNLKDEEDWD